ncbi:saccharopine dehydrogenase NADP-binding domain-containing protein [Frondihabitans sp. 4ASC-45]
MMTNFLIYGATGYTGQLITREAVQRGMNPIVAGRDAAKVKLLADELGLEARVFDLSSEEKTREGVLGVSVVLNVAGPFSVTSGPLLDAALYVKAHYLDTTAELGTFLRSEAADGQAKKAGVMVMSGTGWDVVPSDTLAARTAARVTDPVSLVIALKLFVGTPGERIPLLFSKGSMTSALGFAPFAGSVRSGGTITTRDDSPTRSIDFGEGSEEVGLAPMGDLVTGWHSTGIPEIEVYVAGGIPIPTTAPGSQLPDGPDAADRAIGRARVYAKVTGRDGSTAAGLVDTPTGYGFTQLAAVEIASRIIAGDFTPGFQTPASAYGPSLLEGIGDSRFIDL